MISLKQTKAFNLFNKEKEGYTNDEGICDNDGIFLKNSKANYLAKLMERKTNETHFKDCRKKCNLDKGCVGLKYEKEIKQNPNCSLYKAINPKIKITNGPKPLHPNTFCSRPLSECNTSGYKIMPENLDLSEEFEKFYFSSESQCKDKCSSLFPECTGYYYRKDLSNNCRLFRDSSNNSNGFPKSLLCSRPHFLRLPQNFKNEHIFCNFDMSSSNVQSTQADTVHDCFNNFFKQYKNSNKGYLNFYPDISKNNCRYVGTGSNLHCTLHSHPKTKAKSFILKGTPIKRREGFTNQTSPTNKLKDFVNTSIGNVTVPPPPTTWKQVPQNVYSAGIRQVCKIPGANHASTQVASLTQCQDYFNNTYKTKYGYLNFYDLSSLEQYHPDTVHNCWLSGSNDISNISCDLLDKASATDGTAAPWQVVADSYYIPGTPITSPT